MKRADRRIRTVAYHPLLGVVALQNVRTGKWRCASMKDIAEHGLSGAFRVNRVERWLTYWHRTGGPPILPLLLVGRRVCP